MPLYEYKCRKCGANFEQFRRFSDLDAELACPRCGEKDPERQFSRFARQGDAPSQGCAPQASS